MIRIREPEDLKKDTIPFEIKEYLSKYLQTILQNYGCNSLERIGCIYYLETTEDTLHYSKMGLSHSILETPFEYCECISIKSSHGESNLLHGCYVFNNDYAIDFFGQDSIFDQQTLSTSTKNSGPFYCGNATWKSRPIFFALLLKVYVKNHRDSGNLLIRKAVTATMNTKSIVRL